MIEPILKLDRQPDPPEPSKRSGVRRWLVLGIALCALFAGVVVTMLLALPRPHTRADYMMAGGLATMVALLAFFGVLLSTQVHRAEAFYKRRPK
jgi:bacteriorhodopsin